MGLALVGVAVAVALGALYMRRARETTTDGAVTDVPEPDGRWLIAAAIGIGFAVVAFLGNVVGFFAVLIACRAENREDISSACDPLNDHPDWVFFGGAVGGAAVLAIIYWLGVPWRYVAVIGAAGWAMWLGYLLLAGS